MDKWMFRVIGFVVSLSLAYSASAEGILTLGHELEGPLRLALAPKYAPIRGIKATSKSPVMPKDPYAQKRQEAILAIRLQQAIKRGEVLACTAPEALTCFMGTTALQSVQAWGAGYRERNGAIPLKGPGSVFQTLVLGTGNLFTEVPLETVIPFAFNHNAHAELPGECGIGWGHSFKWRLEKALGAIAITDPTGAMEVFIETKPGEYDNPPGVYGELSAAGKSWIWKDKYGTQYRFDPVYDEYQLRRITFLSPNTYYDITGGEYPGSIKFYLGGQLVSELRFDYSPIYDRIGSIFEPSTSRRWDFTYDANYQLETIVKPAVDGVRPVVRLQHNRQSNITQITDANGDVWRTPVYDEFQRLTQSFDKDSHLYQFGYRFGDPGQLVTEYTLPLGEMYEYVSDFRTGHTYYGKDPAGFTWQVVPDKNFNPVTSIDEDGQTWITEYDRLGNPTVVIDPEQRRWETLYDEYSRVVSTEDPANGICAYVYDKTTFALKEVYNEHGKKVLTASEYNQSGQPRLIEDALGRKTRLTYFPNGLPQTITNSAGVVTTCSYNSLGQLNSVRTPGLPQQSFVYDALGRLRRAINPGAPGEVSFEYDLEGRPTEFTDLAKQKTLVDYSKPGQLVVQSPDKTTLGFVFNENGQTTEIHLPKKTDVMRIVPDERGQAHQVTYPDGTSKAFTYTGTGQVETETNALYVVNYGYDKAGLPTSVHSPYGPYSVTWNYDWISGKGFKFTMMDKAGETEMIYDLLGRLTQENTPTGTLSYPSYSDADELLEMHVSDGREDLVYNWVFDKVTGQLAESTGPFEHTTYHYDKNGFCERMEHGQGRGKPECVQEFRHDGYQVTYAAMSFLDKGKKQLLRSDEVMKVDAHGAPTLVGHAYPEGHKGSTAFGYDLMGRVKTESFLSDFFSFSDRFDYDENGGLTRTRRVTGGKEMIRQLDIDPGDRLTQMRTYEGGKLVEQKDYSYDALGNVKTERVGPDIHSFSYNAMGELTEDDLNKQPWVEHVRDGFGRDLRTNTRQGTKKVYKGAVVIKDDDHIRGGETSVVDKRLGALQWLQLSPLDTARYLRGEFTAGRNPQGETEYGQDIRNTKGERVKRWGTKYVVPLNINQLDTQADDDKTGRIATNYDPKIARTLSKEDDLDAPIRIEHDVTGEVRMTTKREQMAIQERLKARLANSSGVPEDRGWVHDMDREAERAISGRMIVPQGDLDAPMMMNLTSWTLSLGGSVNLALARGPQMAAKTGTTASSKVEPFQMNSIARGGRDPNFHPLGHRIAGGLGRRGTGTLWTNYSKSELFELLRKAANIRYALKRIGNRLYELLPATIRNAPRQDRFDMLDDIILILRSQKTNPAFQDPRLQKAFENFLKWWNQVKT